MEYKHLLKLAASIADHMTGGWRVDRRPIPKNDEYMGVKIIGDNGKVISLYQSYRTKNKIAVMGLCPNFGLSYHQKRNACLPNGSETIQVSPTRKPRHLAADIERRLLPGYEIMLVKAEEKARRFKRNIATLDHVDHALRCVAPTVRGNRNNSDNTERRYYLYDNESRLYRSGEIRINAVSCDVNLSGVSVEKLIQILALLNDGAV